jgi:hypothetical protein
MSLIYGLINFGVSKAHSLFTAPEGTHTSRCFQLYLVNKSKDLTSVFAGVYKGSCLLDCSAV